LDTESGCLTHTGAGLAALFGMVLGAGDFLSLHRRAFLGPPGSEVVADAMDLRPRELILVSLLALLILIAGIYPDLVLDLTWAATEDWITRLVSPG